MINGICAAAVGSSQLDPSQQHYPMVILERYGSMNIDRSVDRRYLLLKDPIRVGRAVGKQKPDQENAIYECRVLSRNQAIIWVRNNQFYIKDTKSSNGTFVNNVKLEGDEEAEIFTDDIVQFGIDVADGNSKDTLAHTCVVVQIKCTNADGVLTPPRIQRYPVKVKSDVSNDLSNRQTKGIFHYQQPTSALVNVLILIEDIKRREDALRKRLFFIDDHLSQVASVVDSRLEDVISQDDLMCRIDSLESQLLLLKSLQSSESVDIDMQLLEANHLCYQQAASHKMNVLKLEEENQRLKSEIHFQKENIERLEYSLQFLQSSLSMTSNGAQSDSSHLLPEKLNASQTELNFEQVQMSTEVANGIFPTDTNLQSMPSEFVQDTSSLNTSTESDSQPNVNQLAIEPSNCLSDEPVLDVKNEMTEYEVGPTSWVPLSHQMSSINSVYADERQGNICDVDSKENVSPAPNTNPNFLSYNSDIDDIGDFDLLCKECFSDSESIATLSDFPLTIDSNVNNDDDDTTKIPVTVDRACSPFVFLFSDELKKDKTVEMRSCGTNTLLECSDENKPDGDIRETSDLYSNENPIITSGVAHSWTSMAALVGVVFSSSAGLFAAWNLLKSSWTGET